MTQTGAEADTVRTVTEALAVQAMTPDDTERPPRRPVVNVGTNLIYDLASMPSLSVEASWGGRFSAAVSATYGWNDGWPFKDRVRVVTADAGLRYWPGADEGTIMRRGLHIGGYGAVYRYDFLFGRKGQQAKANWGAGIDFGYAIPLSSLLSIDFSVGVGYVSGQYKEYEVSDDMLRHNVWMADKVRHYFGPTKAEAALVWHLGGKAPRKAKKGGAQ